MHLQELSSHGMKGLHQIKITIIIYIYISILDKMYYIFIGITYIFNNIRKNAPRDCFSDHVTGSLPSVAS